MWSANQCLLTLDEKHTVLIFHSPVYMFHLQNYEGTCKSLNNRKFFTRNKFFTRVLTEIVCVLFFDIVPLLRNTLGPPVHKLADAL